jgi:hypothetical protein
LLQGGGFGLIAVDLSDIPTRLVRHIPLESWYRFRRAVEDTPTILLFLAQESNAKTCAALGLRLESEATSWLRLALKAQPDFIKHSHSWLFGGFSASGEVTRSLLQAAAGIYSAGEKAEKLSPPHMQEVTEAYQAVDKKHQAGQVIEFVRYGMPPPQLISPASHPLFRFVRSN